MNNEKSNIGFILIVIGLLGLWGHFVGFGDLNWSNFWPIFVLVPGLLFELGFFSGKSPAAMLVPGGILTTIGLLFFFETFTDWRFSGSTWPVYIFAPAIGLFQLYLFEKPHNNALLIPVGILGVVGGMCFLGISIDGIWDLLFHNSLVWPIALVVIGIIIIIAQSSNNSNKHL
ncbi:hypothetical protein [Cellulosilyticum ruminicola]|uniref:hypothetical protein n=1 Tax=Cellulosilyticum ruminicola TaxID=425254 RepID=UPI0006D0091F|nr:hypothetical protein [Cellulosilyticum ruminicola]